MLKKSTARLPTCHLDLVTRWSHNIQQWSESGTNCGHCPNSTWRGE